MNVTIAFIPTTNLEFNVSFHHEPLRTQVEIVGTKSFLQLFLSFDVKILTCSNFKWYAAELLSNWYFFVYLWIF